MDFDFEHHLAATERTVVFQDVERQPAGSVTLSRNFPTTVADLWDAVTSPERIGRWFAPVTCNPEPGGRYQVEGNAGGSITECVPLSHFALTWEFAGDVGWVEVRVSQFIAGETSLSLTHTSLLTEHWDRFGPGAGGVGWELGFLGLALHVADPAAPKPDEAEFVASPDGRSFITGASEGWAGAAIAAGMGAEAAHAAAGRTAAFFRGDAE